jgi:hypothetical protein
VAYLKYLQVKCAACPKRASKEVFDRWNGSCGKFCARCAEAKLKQQLKAEASELREVSN